MSERSSSGQLFPRDRPIGHGHSIEAKSVEQYFRNRTLDSITLDSLNNDYPHDPAACLVAMTNEAFAFFLPAFMRIALNDYKRANVIPEAIINRFVEMAEGRDDERRNAILATYSTSALEGIASFLAKMSELYWHRYPEDSALRALQFWRNPRGSEAPLAPTGPAT